ncbi:hypothetical protein ACHAW5_003357 [Stephanodiscus triporus]|uniref:Uncharacterized protein n=1 Tax=Stephanodiscus triporus TaxID=2934178 RepID=A0ABD3NVW7_9STRA
MMQSQELMYVLIFWYWFPIHLELASCSLRMYRMVQSNGGVRCPTSNNQANGTTMPTSGTKYTKESCSDNAELSPPSYNEHTRITAHALYLMACIGVKGRSGCLHHVSYPMNVQLSELSKELGELVAIKTCRSFSKTIECLVFRYPRPGIIPTTIAILNPLYHHASEVRSERSTTQFISPAPATQPTEPSEEGSFTRLLVHDDR